MNEKEKIEHEVIKNAIKMGIMNNRNLSEIQKQQAINNVDLASKRADWFVEMLRQSGFVI